MFRGVSRTIPFAIRFGKVGFSNALLPIIGSLKQRCFSKYRQRYGVYLVHCRQRAWSRHWILSSRTPSRPETSQIARMALLCPRRWRIATSCWNWPPRVEYSSCARQRTVVTRWWIIHHRYRRFFRFYHIYMYICIYFYIYNEIEFLVKRERFLYIGPRFIDYFTLSSCVF